MTNAKSLKKPITLVIPVILVVAVLCYISGCARMGGNDPAIVLEPVGDNIDESQLYYFDYEEIEIIKSQSIDLDIKNTNSYLDFYGDLIIAGEIINSSQENLTDVEVTIDVLDGKGEKLVKNIIPIKSEYIQAGKKHPFIYSYDDKARYIDIDSIRIGVNYKKYNNVFEGNPLARDLKYYYQENRLVIEGLMVNIGRKTVKELEVLATFYDKRDRVVFIRECYIRDDSLKPLAKQDYKLELNLDGNIPKFTHYDVEVYFTDEL